MCTIRGSKEDGDTQIDMAHFQPSHKDDINMDAATINRITDLIQKAREQQQSLRNKLADLPKEFGTEVAQTDSLKSILGRLEREVDAFSSEPLQSQIEKLSAEWEAIAERRKPLESGHNIPGDLGMVAVYVEQAICAYVLPELFSVNDDSAKSK